MAKLPGEASDSFYFCLNAKEVFEKLMSISEKN